MCDRECVHVKLPQPPLLDFSLLKKNDDVRIVIFNSKHKFATDAQFSGTDIMKQPIFGSCVYINNEVFSETTFGLPFMRFSQGSTPRITYENETKFTFNIHYHGLNTVGAVDGTSMETVFGHSTLLGPKVTFQFPKVTNNQSLLWFHSHNMFVSMELAYGGILGLLQIVDEPTKWLSQDFKYSDNNILLAALDMDLTNSGTQTFANLVSDENRSNFTVINGISAVNWYTTEKVPFVNMLQHTTSRNLVKIDILNTSLNWRVFYMGVCDEDQNIRSFYLVQSDGGLVNPNKLKIVSVPVAGRIGIIIDLNKFKHQIAYLFFYNYDLTEILASMPTFPNQLNNPTLTGTIPDFEKVKNATPYPTPIPDPNQQNQQENYTNLDYPPIKLITQQEQILTNGSIRPQINNKHIKPFLKIELEDKFTKIGCDFENRQLCLTNTIEKIRRTVFGCQNYDKYKYLLTQPDFEYNPKFNYLSFLNPNYFYNLPNYPNSHNENISVPTRNIFLFPETNINAVDSGNINGTTEYVDGANRIMTDLWNSNELDLGWALLQYEQTPNNYKPPNLPTSKFRIYKTNDDFSNTAMISNDTLQIQIFAQEIAYGDLTSIPLTTVTIIFPPTPSSNLLNLQEWIDLVNRMFQQTMINIPGTEEISLNTILECDWSFFPYALNFLYQKTVHVKSAVIKTKNESNYWIRLLARWPLIQFFGKPLTGNTLSTDGKSTDLMSQLRKKQQMMHTKNKYNRQTNIKNATSSKPRCQPTCCVNKENKSLIKVNKNRTQYIKCDEIGIYGIYDAEIQQIFPFYATSDGEVQLPIACMKRDAELIIQPQQTYIGLYDGYLNDNLNSFSVKLKSSEKWIYTNGDCTDAHPLHFHLTSGFATPHSSYDSSKLLSYERTYDPLLYSRDIYKIGPQETLSFLLNWSHYSSCDKTETPALDCIGGVIHCHFLQHNDANSMIIQYFVDRS